MEIKELMDCKAKNEINDEGGHRRKEYAIFAIGGGAIISIKKVSSNNTIRSKAAIFICDSGPLGCGNDERKGRKVAEECLENDDILHRYSFEKAIVVATLGGGMGTGGAPVFARYLNEKGIEVANIVTLPFKFEGKLKLDKSMLAVNEMSRYSKSTIILNEDICQNLYKQMSFTDYLSMFDRYIEETILFTLGLKPANDSWYRRIMNNCHNLLTKLVKNNFFS